MEEKAVVLPEEICWLKERCFNTQLVAVSKFSLSYIKNFDTQSRMKLFSSHFIIIIVVQEGLQSDTSFSEEGSLAEILTPSSPDLVLPSSSDCEVLPSLSAPDNTISGNAVLSDPANKEEASPSQFSGERLEV